VNVEDYEGNPEIPEIKLDIQISEVECAKPRKLKANWSMEASRDLRDIFRDYAVGDWVWAEVEGVREDRVVGRVTAIRDATGDVGTAQAIWSPRYNRELEVRPQSFPSPAHPLEVLAAEG